MFSKIIQQSSYSRNNRSVDDQKKKQLLIVQKMSLSKRSSSLQRISTQVDKSTTIPENDFPNLPKTFIKEFLSPNEKNYLKIPNLKQKRRIFETKHGYFRFSPIKKKPGPYFFGELKNELILEFDWVYNISFLNFFHQFINQINLNYN